MRKCKRTKSFSMSYTLTYQLSPERTRGLHGSPMNRPQAVNWANRTAAASPRSLRCAAIRAAPIASGTFPLHALRFGLQAPVSAQRRRVRKVPPQAVRNLPHQKMSIHHATTLNVRDASRLSVIGVYMQFARSEGLGHYAPPSHGGTTLPRGISPSCRSIAHRVRSQGTTQDLEGGGLLAVST